MPDYHLAQINIARMLAPLESDLMQGFVTRLDEINALADDANGFIWRLQTDDDMNATSIRAFDDNMLIVNLSVWESIEALHAFTYRTAHAELMRQRKDWFSALGQTHLALWWIHAGHIPDVAEAQDKLALVQAQGATPQAFTFTKRFTIAEMLALHG